MEDRLTFAEPDPVDEALRRAFTEPVVEVDPFAGVTSDPWAGARAAALARPTADPWEAARWAPAAQAAAAQLTATTASLERNLAKIRWSGAMKMHGRPTLRQQIRHDVIVPPWKPSGSQLAWLPAYVYEESDAESFEGDCLWPTGVTLDMTQAAEDLACSGMFSPESDFYIWAQWIPDAEWVLQSCDCGAHEMWGLEEVVEVGLRLRAQLAADPDIFAAELPGALFSVGLWAGLKHTPTVDEVMEAIILDPTHGLGGAAIDRMTWTRPEDYGGTGEALAEAIDFYEQDTYLKRLPLENFVLPVDRLHPGTLVSRDYSGLPRYRLFGEYATVRVDYTSDLTGAALAGWRTIYLEPYGEPRQPDFRNCE